LIRSTPDREARKEFESNSKLKAKMGVGEAKKLRIEESESKEVFEKAKKDYDQVLSDPELNPLCQ